MNNEQEIAILEKAIFELENILTEAVKENQGAELTLKYTPIVTAFYALKDAKRRRIL